MALFDLQAFLQERAQAFDENLDITSGSPFDTQVIQPTLRRLGTDPYTVDLAVFLSDRLKQAFPDMATDEGDALTDLLIKPVTLLWDPFVREVFRIRNSLSFQDPSTLTTDEADALGANLFSARITGSLTRGIARLYFAQPRSATLSPTNFFTSKTGLHFFPDGTQAITVNEMLLNQDGGTYYFDVNVVAEAPGTEYNIEPNDIINVANLEGTVKATNLARFSSGVSEETAVQFVGRTQQELTERSMVTLRGIGARIPSAFPEVTRIAVVGFGDPEMQRDVIRGGGLGVVLAGGVAGQTVLDGLGQPTTRRFQVLDAGVDFAALVGTDPAASYVLTVFNAFNGPPTVRDLPVLSVVSSNTIDVDTAELLPFYTARSWTLRKEELTLSGIPGGILYPDTVNGTVTIPDNEVHIGGMYDVSVRGAAFDSSTLVLENLSDASPAAAGVELDMRHSAAGRVTLGDLVLGVTYAVGDATYVALTDARVFGFTLQILTGPNAGDYRVVSVNQTVGSPPELTLDTVIPVVTGTFRWRLVDVIDVDLVDPRDTRISGSDLQSVQNTSVFTTASGADLIALGVSVGDTVRVSGGLNAGDYTVTAVVAFDAVQVDRNALSTASSLSYEIFKSNTAGGLDLPLIRVTQMELLDSTGQPVGSVVPYARPIDIQSRAFENPGRGVKVDITDGVLGIVSLPAAGSFDIGGQNLTIQFKSDQGLSPVTVFFSAGPKTAQQAVAEINAAASSALSANTVLAVVVGGDRVGIVPIDPYTVISSPGTALVGLFGDNQTRTSADIRSATNWSAVSPSIDQDDLDVAQVLDGSQIGFYGDLSYGTNNVLGDPTYTGLFSGNLSLATLAAFAPEVGRHIQIGSRSIGSARCYFLEPTSVEFTRSSFFSTMLADGSSVRYFPDPTLSAIRIPAQPTAVNPNDGSSVNSSGSYGYGLFTSASQDFILSNVVAGDLLVIEYVPITASITLADPVTGLALQSLVVSLDGGADQTILFSTDLTGFPTSVSRNGVASQINSATGKTIAAISSGNMLELSGGVSIIVRATGSANSLLGFSTTVDSNNTAAHAGTYTVALVTSGQLTVYPAYPSAVPTEAQESFMVMRPGVQRICSTQMNTNVAEASLYYFDVELVSEGTGDQYNIDSAQQLTAAGYRSDGYYLTTDDTDLTFSPVEKPRLHVSRSILEVGVSDDPRNATQLSGQNLEVTYDRAAIVGDVQNFASAETERVVCANPLARHLVPHFVRFDFQYVGGSRTDLVVTDMTTYINGLYPADYLESSSLVTIASQRGATSVKSPIDLVAVVHQYDRSVQAQRSQNALNTGRLAAFVPDVINVNRLSG